MTPAIGVLDAGRLETAGADPDALHQIGSVTKVFTGLLLALEVVEGRLTLESAVGDLVPELADRPVGGVRLGALVTHTSGLPRLPPGMWCKAWGAQARDPYADIDEPALWSALATMTPRRSARPRYSNLGFGLLGTVLARHLEASYEAAVRERIAVPLGMERTTSRPADPRPGHTRRGRARPTAWTFDALAGAGALWSTVSDMSAFMRAQLDPPDGVLGEAIALTQRSLVGTGRTEQAMAWMKLSSRHGSLLWHNGGTAGFRSFVGVDRGRRRGVVVLGDTDRSVDRWGFRLLRDPGLPECPA